jgi:uncharacterized membrane protein
MEQIDIDMEELCEAFSEKTLIFDSKQEFELLEQSQNIKIKSFTLKNILETRERYVRYLQYINFELYAEAGLRIKILIEDYINSRASANFLEVLACKTQVIDKLILELLDWLGSLE